MSPRKKVFITGSYGKQNTGDDALAIVTAWGIERYWDSGNVGVLARDLPVFHSFAKSCFSKRQYFRGQDLLELLANLLLKPLIVYGGGSIFNKKICGITNKNYILLKAKKMGLIRLGAVGVSLGPFKDNDARESVATFLSHFDFLALRDERSYREACLMHLPFEPVMAFDLAALLPFVFRVEKRLRVQSQKPVLGVSLCHYERYVGGNEENETRREERIKTTLLEVVQRACPKIRFFVFSGTNDEPIARSFAEIFGKMTDVEIVPYDKNTLKTWNDINDCDAVLATRLHAGVFSCFSKVPFMQVEYHQKCTDFLEEIGFPENYKIGDMHEKPHLIADKLISLLNGDTSEYRIINRRKVIRSSLKNFLATQSDVLRVCK